MSGDADNLALAQAALDELVEQRRSARPHRRLTASGLSLALACAASHALPDVEDIETDAMRAGTGRHAFLDALVRAASAPGATAASAREAALATVSADASWRATCEAIDVEHLLELTGAREGVVTVGGRHTWWPADDTALVDVAGAAHRDYRGDPAAIYGTSDWIVEAPKGGWTVIDFKGSLRGAPAAQHPQVAFYALSLARSYELDAVDVALVYVDEDGALTRDDATLDAWALDAWATRFAELHARVTAARAAAPGDFAKVGDHCGNCPAFRMCPAQVLLVRELVAAPPPGAGHLPKVSDEEAGRVWERAHLYRDALDVVIKTISERAKRTGLPLPDGRWLMPVDTTRRTVDAARALPVLRELVGDRADSFIDQSISAGRVDDLAGELAAANGETVKASKQRVWDALREARAVKESTYPTLRPKKLAGGGA